MNRMERAYGDGFYGGQEEGSLTSARASVPIIMEAISPDSVLDVGCGVGHWVNQFRAHGVAVTHGIDGPWANGPQSQLSPGDFFEFDFGKAPMPFDPPLGRYDLLTSFEFIEHIDEDRSDALVDLFCRLSDAVVIGGAVPYQGGTHHVNEQWPSYWAEKFAARGYVACDFLRPAIWNVPGVEPWYAQDTIAYFKGKVPDRAADMARTAWASFSGQAAPLVHPGLWEMAKGPQPHVSFARRGARKIKRLLS